MNGEKRDNEDGKFIEITGDDVAPELPPTPVDPNIKPAAEKNPATPPRPEGTGLDQRRQF